MTEQYTEHRLYVKRENDTRAWHHGIVSDVSEWSRGIGPQNILKSETGYRRVMFLSVYEYKGTVGFPAKRGKLLFFLANDSVQEDK